MNRTNPMTVVLVVGAALLLFGRSAVAQDVYNFYFQKAPGPQTVIQGGAPPDANNGKPETAPAAPAAPLPAPIQDVPALSAESTGPGAAPAAERPRWLLGFGVASVSDYFNRCDWGCQQPGRRSPADIDATYSRYVATAQFNPSKYWGVEAALAFGATGGGKEWESITGRSISHALVPSFGLTATPLHLSMFGYEAISIGFQTGFMQNEMQDYSSPRLETPMAAAAASPESPRSLRRWNHYWGAKVGVNISQRIGVELAFRRANVSDRETDAKMASLALVTRF